MVSAAAVEDTGGGVLAGGAAAAPTPEEAAAALAARRVVDEAADEAAGAGPEHPWAGAALWPFELRIAPVKERRCVSVLWPMPATASQHLHTSAPASRYLSHLLGHEGEGSLFAALQVRISHDLP